MIPTTTRPARPPAPVRHQRPAQQHRSACPAVSTPPSQAAQVATRPQPSRVEARVANLATAIVIMLVDSRSARRNRSAHGIDLFARAGACAMPLHIWPPVATTISIQGGRCQGRQPGPARRSTATASAYSSHSGSERARIEPVPCELARDTRRVISPPASRCAVDARRPAQGGGDEVLDGKCASAVGPLTSPQVCCSGTQPLDRLAERQSACARLRSLNPLRRSDRASLAAHAGAFRWCVAGGPK